jgi:hypothetical protein
MHGVASSTPIAAAAEGLIVDQLREAAQRATLHDDPFPHLVSDGVFAAAFFQALVAELPDDTRYERPEAPSATGVPGAERMILSLSGSTARAGSAVHATNAALTTPSVCQAWLDRLAAGSAGAHAASGLRSQAFLSRDYPPYAIGPHTDVPRRVLSMILYLSPRDAPDDWGTTLFRPLDPRFECTHGRHYPFDAFVPARRVPFRPNRAIVFLRSHRSFHGLMPIEPASGPRDTLLYEIMHGDGPRA